MTRIKQRMKAIEAALQPERSGYALLCKDGEVYREHHGGPALTEAELEAFYERHADKEFILIVEIPTITRESKNQKRRRCMTRPKRTQGLLSGTRGGYFTPRQKERLERLAEELPGPERAALFAHFERIRRGGLVLEGLLSTETSVSKIEGFDVEGRTITVRMRDGNKGKSDI